MLKKLQCAQELIMDNTGKDGTFSPMYRELAEQLGKDIQAKGLHDGDFYCTLKSICQRYHVSITTARKAVSCMTHSNILSCRSARGIYIRSTMLLNTAGTLTNSILIFDGHSVYSNYFSLRLGAMLREFSAIGYTTQIIGENSLTPEVLEQLGSSLKAVVFNRNAALRFGSFIRSSNRCPVLLEHYMPQYENAANLVMVKKDYDGEIRLTLDFFQGKKRVAAVVFEKDAYAPFQQAFRNAGLDLEEVYMERSSAAEGRSAVDRLEKYPAGTCFWVQDDFSALGILDEFLKRGRDLRAERALLVSANPRSNYTKALEIPTIGYDPVSWGQRAAHELCYHLKTGMGSRLVNIPAENNFDFEKTGYL